MTNAADFGRSIATLTMRNALDSYEDGRLEEAAKACASMPRSDPGSFDALHLLWPVKMAAGDMPEAVWLLTAAANLRPPSHEAATRQRARGARPASMGAGELRRSAAT
jgi:hypothetical protein